VKILSEKKASAGKEPISAEHNPEKKTPRKDSNNIDEAYKVGPKKKQRKVLPIYCCFNMLLALSKSMISYISKSKKELKARLELNCVINFCINTHSTLAVC
jgi:hypothetical protein